MKIPSPSNTTAAGKLFNRLINSGLSLLVVRKNRVLFTSSAPGVHPLLELTQRFPDGLKGATVVDLIVGGCAARVFIYLKVKAVLGLTVSAFALRLLKKARIPCYYQRLVSEIRNRQNTDICPFEKISRRYPDPEKLIPAIQRRLKKLGREIPSPVANNSEKIPANRRFSPDSRRASR